MGARKFAPLATLQDLNGSQGKASAFYAKLDNSGNAAIVVDEIKNVPGMGTYVVRAMKEWLLLMTPDNTPGLSSFIRVVVGISMIIGFMVIFQAMYTAVMERTREIGILKSIGASKFYIMNVILAGEYVAVDLRDYCRRGIQRTGATRDSTAALALAAD